MTMTDLNGKIEDTIITLNEIAPRRSLSSDERFLFDLIKYVRQLEKDNANLLSLITTDEVDNSTLVECLSGVREIVTRYNYIERSEELCRWVEKLEAIGGEK